MDSLTVISLLQHLLPGFVTAWVFYGLTSHSKPSQFERVIQALIFSFIIQIVLSWWKALCFYLGKYVVLGEWANSTELAYSFFISLVLGLAVAYITNKDILHTFARKLGVSEKSSHASEWTSTFSSKKAYVYLRMEDGESIYGWPIEWPTEPNNGHFRLEHVSWITREGKENSLENIDTVLVKAADVKSVMFVNEPKNKKPLNEESQ